MEDDLVLASFTATTSQPRELNREADEKLKEARMRRMEADDEQMSGDDPGTVTPSNGNQDSPNKGKRSEKIEHNALKKRRKRYILRDEDPGPGLLAAREIIPMALCNERGDLEVFARGITMSWEERGQLVHHRGNARITIMRPGAWPQPKTPSRGRTRQAREWLFKNEGQMRRPKEETENFDEPVTQPHSHTNIMRRKDGDGRIAPEEECEGREEGRDREEMTRGVLEAVVENLVDDPLDGPYETRTYEITEHEDRHVMATHLPHDNKVAKEMEDRERTSREKEELDEAVNKQVGSADQIPFKGSDPPPSKGRTGETLEYQKIEIQRNSRSTPNKLMMDEVGNKQKDLERVRETLERRKTTRRQQKTHLKDSSPSFLQSQFPTNNLQNATCSPKMNQHSNPAQAPQNLWLFAAICATAPAISRAPQPVFQIRPVSGMF